MCKNHSFEVSFMNVSGTFNALRLLVKPQLCIPHLEVSTFNHIPIPLTHRGFPTIKAVVLDKDNCFAVKHTTSVYPAYLVRSPFFLAHDTCAVPCSCPEPIWGLRRGNIEMQSAEGSFMKTHFERLRAAYPKDRLLIVSNRAGTDGHLAEADVLETTTGVKVLQHSTKKPGCSNDILRYFHGCADLSDIKPNEIAVIGDRIFTDIMLANMMGSLGVWVRDGVHPQNGILDRMEKGLPHGFETLGFKAPMPS